MIVPAAVLRQIHFAGDHDEDEEETTRLELYTDAVFSIIATVLILPLMEQLKEMSNSGETKNDYAYTLTINYLAFWVTYFMLGMLIRNHSQLFYRIKRVTGVVVALNTFYLFWLTAYPFVCALIMAYEFDSYLTVDEGGWVPWALHAFVTFMAGVAQYGLVLYLYFSSGSRFVPGMRRRMLFISFTYFTIMTIGCATVVIVSFFDPAYAVYGYLVVPILFGVVRRIRNRLMPEYENELDQVVEEEPTNSDLDHIASSSEHEDEHEHEVPASTGRRVSEPRIQSMQYEAAVHYDATVVRKQEAIAITKHYARFQKERLEAFSDGIFAISVTLVAANLRIPEFESEEGFNLFTALIDMWQQYFSQVLSFMILGIMWYMHHEIFKTVAKVDDVLWWINYSFLMLVSSLPFFAELMATFVRSENAIEYIGALCLGLIVMGMLQLSVWLYLLYRRDDHGPHQELFGTRMLTVMTVALSTTPLVAAVTFFVALKTDYAVWLLCASPIIVLVLFATCGAPWESLLDSYHHRHDHQHAASASSNNNHNNNNNNQVATEATLLAVDSKPKNL